MYLSLMVSMMSDLNHLSISGSALVGYVGNEKQFRNCTKERLSILSIFYSKFPVARVLDVFLSLYPYAMSKYAGEQYALHWNMVYNLPVISIRIFNAYGVRVRTTGAYGAVFGVFLAQKLNNLPLTVVGDGNQTRDFIHVNDLVDAVIKVAEHSTKNEIFNVASGEETSVNKIADMIGGKKISIPKRPGEPNITHANISKISSKNMVFLKVINLFFLVEESMS